MKGRCLNDTTLLPFENTLFLMSYFVEASIYSLPLKSYIGIAMA